MGQCCRTSYLAIFYIVDTRSLALAKINAVKNQAVCILKMPGVPSGRACDGCRRQKKKVCPRNHEVAKRSLLRLPQVRLCDTMFTVCSPGVRMRRIWAAKVPFQKSKVLSTSSALRREAVSLPAASCTPSLSPSPSNELNVLISAFLDTIKPTMDCRFNLAWTYGPFLHHLPRRLGTNAALDSATRALVCAHRDFSLHRPVTIRSLAEYSHAVQTLRQSMDNPTKAHSIDTACAVILLTLCQVCQSLLPL